MYCSASSCMEYFGAIEYFFMCTLFCGEFYPNVVKLCFFTILSMYISMGASVYNAIPCQ